MILLNLLIVFLCSKICVADLPACTGSSRCPTGGMWSEWVVTGEDTSCPTSCGSCSSLYYTRSCLSSVINCTCSGDSYKYTLCNTQACSYPSQTSCCTPYLTMIMNSSLHCGPIPKDTSSPDTACCPSGGLWSDWSGFARDNTSAPWVQTRECLSTSLGCPCTGATSNNQTDCPCSTQQTALQVRALCSGGAELTYSPNNMIIDQDTCILIGIVKANNLDNDWPCDNYVTYKNFLAGKIYYHGTDEQCYVDYPYDCAARGTGLTMNISFTCDPSIQQWRYDYSGVPSDGYVLVQQTYLGGG